MQDLEFRHFYRHYVHIEEGEKIRNKVLKDYINISVVVDIGCGNTIRE